MGVRMNARLGLVLSGLGRIPGLFLGRGRFGAGLGEIGRAVNRRARNGRRRPPPRGDCCIDLPPEVRKRPDPLLYAQYYLMRMGLAVTWDNPDIRLHEADPSAVDGVGAPVASGDLLGGRAYKVVVRVWNGSYDAPAVGLPVHLSYLSFGVGTASHPVGSTTVNLGVKGSPHCPAFAVFEWEAPPEGGHFCLQARLEWWDDANPDNNLGQENVNVGVAHSPAEFTFLLRNDASVDRRFALEADAYRLPELPPCDEQAPPSRDPARGQEPRRPTRLAESRARWERTLREQGYGSAPVPPGWSVRIEPAELALEAGGERPIRVMVEPPAGSGGPPTPLNVHAFALGGDGRRTLAGGVTLVVERA